MKWRSSEALRRLPVWRVAAPVLVGLVASLAAMASAAERDPAAEIARYRQMLEEGNPAELLELQGEALWSAQRGPRKVSLEQCDLGLGPGRLEGAYAQLPRHFADTGRVEDVESRLVTCMVELQGVTREAATRNWYKPGSDLEALTTFVAAKSRGYAIDVPAAHPREARMAALGEAIFWRRSGPLDFGCATCHALDARRIRLQDVPNLAGVAGARATMPTWPAYRVSQSAVWTMERRLIDCVRQMRWPEPDYLSEAIIALQVYLQRNASGAVMTGPGIKR